MTVYTAGLNFLSIDGTVYNVVGSVTYNPGGISRETQSGLDGPHGAKKMLKGPQIKLQIRDSSSLSLTSFNAQDSHTLYVGLASGKQLAGSNMWLVDTQEASVDDGTISLTFEGMSGSVTESTV